MYVLDTDVMSHLRRVGKVHPHVAAWAAATPTALFFISSITIYEIELEALAMERKAAAQGRIMRAWIDKQIRPDFEGRILSLDTEVAQRCAQLHFPHPRPLRDSFIAATALVHAMTVVTRNVEGFKPMGVEVLNPWEREP